MYRTDNKRKRRRKRRRNKSLKYFFPSFFENHKINEFTNLELMEDSLHRRQGGWSCTIDGRVVFQKSENTSLSLSLSGFGRSSVESGYLSKLEVSSGLL